MRIVITADAPASSGDVEVLFQAPDVKIDLIDQH